MTNGPLPLNEAISTGITTSVLGMVIVFAVLIILMAVLKIMEKVFYKPAEPQQSVPKPAEPAATLSAPASVQNDEELVAVLTAAVAASLNTSTYNLKIKSYRRVGGNASAWNKAGLRDTIDSRF